MSGPVFRGDAGRPAVPAAAAAVIVLATVAVYARAAGAGFVGDDFMILYRLRQLGSAWDASRFFTTEFFDYYRPIGFLAHAVDYRIAGSDPRQFHLTNIALHVVNTILVLLVARRLSPHSLAGPLAALLFGLHASNHEAVIWISARFDLLATSFALAALWWMMRDDRHTVLPACLFGLAILSKEAAVALPLAAAAWSVFCLRAGITGTLRRVLPWLAALAVYAALRELGGGVSAVGGTGRLPKLMAFGSLLTLMIVLSGRRWEIVAGWLRRRRALVAAIAASALAAGALAAASGGSLGRLAAEKLAVSGFAIFHLFSPILEISAVPFYLDVANPRYWATGLALAVGATAVLLLMWRRLLDDPRMWFLGAALTAALLPVSALTEGQRYLYLPSAVFSMAAAVLVAEIRADRRRVALAACGVVVAVSAVQIARKIDDWRWAGAMTAAGASLVDSALAPACNTGHVVFLTSPVAVRGVYTHFYYETFELPRGCRPEVFQVVARTLRVDTSADVRWIAPRQIELVIERYPGTFVLSQDLRHFDRPVRRGASETVTTALGVVRAEPHGDAGLRLTLDLADGVQQDPPLFFYYSQGRIRQLVPQPGGPQPNA